MTVSVRNMYAPCGGAYCSWAAKVRLLDSFMYCSAFVIFALTPLCSCSEAGIYSSMLKGTVLSPAITAL
jgi:hypothetical protein